MGGSWGLGQKWRILTSKFEVALKCVRRENGQKRAWHSIAYQALQMARATRLKRGYGVGTCPGHPGSDSRPIGSTPYIHNHYGAHASQPAYSRREGSSSSLNRLAGAHGVSASSASSCSLLEYEHITRCTTPPPTSPLVWVQASYKLKRPTSPCCTALSLDGLTASLAACDAAAASCARKLISSMRVVLKTVQSQSPAC